MQYDHVMYAVAVLSPLLLQLWPPPLLLLLLLKLLLPSYVIETAIILLCICCDFNTDKTKTEKTELEKIAAIKINADDEENNTTLLERLSQTGVHKCVIKYRCN